MTTNLTKENILKLIRLNGSQEAALFDAEYDEEINWLAEELSFYYIQLSTIINSESTTADERDVASLFWNAQNTILASLQLFRTGFLMQSASMVRGAIEIACTAYDLYKNPNKKEAFEKCEYKSTSSIEIAKEVDPDIGEWWGSFLSNVFTHINPAHGLPQGTSHGLMAVGGIFDDSESKTQILTLSAIILSFHKVSSFIEYIFANKLPHLYYWQKSAHGLIRHKGEKEQKSSVVLIKRSLKVFPEIKEDIIKALAL